MVTLLGNTDRVLLPISSCPFYDILYTLYTVDGNFNLFHHHHSNLIIVATIVQQIQMYISPLMMTISDITSR